MKSQTLSAPLCVKVPPSVSAKDDRVKPQQFKPPSQRDIKDLKTKPILGHNVSEDSFDEYVAYELMAEERSESSKSEMEDEVETEMEEKSDSSKSEMEDEEKMDDKEEIDDEDEEAQLGAWFRKEQEQEARLKKTEMTAQERCKQM